MFLREKIAINLLDRFLKHGITTMKKRPFIATSIGVATN
jgi:hypothetical protein